MEPPTYRGFGALHGAKLDVFKAMRPLAADDVVRGQFIGYRDEPGVADDSDVETFCALRLLIDSWRWAGVPWYLRSGKCLPETASEILVQLKPPPQQLFDDSAPAGGPANYLRFGLASDPAIALAARVKRPGEEFSATSANSSSSTLKRTNRPPTNDSSPTRWPATARCLPEKTPSKPRGRSSIPSSRTTTTPTLTDQARGDPTKPTR